MDGSGSPVRVIVQPDTLDLGVALSPRESTTLGVQAQEAPGHG